MLNNESITQQLQADLRELVEQTAGRKMSTPKDFDFLSGMIFERTHEQINSFTLKRFWGYINRGGCGKTTLNIMCRFVGYIDWDIFCLKNAPNQQEESGQIINNQINLHELKRGDKILLRWQPNREVVFRFEGMDMFTVVESKNSKLQIGDTFHTSTIIANQPLLLTCLVQEGKAPQNYVCGQKHGVQFLML